MEPKGKKGDRRATSNGKENNTQEKPPKKYNLRSFVFIAVVALVFRLFLMQNYVIVSGSMENTLLVGDFLAVNRVATGSKIPFTDFKIPGYADPRRGDILVFDPHHDNTPVIVKRVVGVPGDTLEMRSKVLYHNGLAQDEPYVVLKRKVPAEYEPEMLWQLEHLVGGPRLDYRPTEDTWGPIVVPKGHYFMMGDNRDDSIDSRRWGFLDGRRFLGRAVGIFFSYNRGSVRPFPWLREIRGSRIFRGVR